MEFNVHTPERQPNESQEQYRSRQRLSRLIARGLRSMANGNTGRQQKNPEANALRAINKKIGARQAKKARKALAPGRVKNDRLEAARILNLDSLDAAMRGAA